MHRRSWLLAIAVLALAAAAAWAGGARLWRVLLRMHGHAPAGAGTEARTTGAPSEGSGDVAYSPDGWPDTRAGAAARRWVEAFSKGEPAMRACLTEILAPESLAERSIEERIETYRGLRERFGSLALASIDRSAPGELQATLLASDLSRHRFVFTVQTEPPYKLISVGRLERRGGGHSGFRH